MYCKHCGKETKEENKFCNYCGQKITNEIPTQKTETKDREIRITFGKSLFLKIILGIIGIVIVYIIFAEAPFSFLIKQRSINQDLTAVSVVNIVCESQDSEELSGGSGTIVTTDGLIITNAHIIPRNEENLLTPEEGCLVILPDQYSGEPKEVYWAEPIVYPYLSEQYD